MIFYDKFVCIKEGCIWEVWEQFNTLKMWIRPDYVSSIWEKSLIPELTYTDLDSKDMDIRQTYLWSVLFAAGYLTDIGETDGGQHRLVIPNAAVPKLHHENESW